jgi:hypothetical protein
MNAEIKSDDEPLDRLTKSVPAEFASVFLALNSFFKIGDIDNSKDTVLMCSFILLLIMLPFYLWRVRQIRMISQHVASFLALFIWAFNINPDIFGYNEWLTPHSSAIGGASVILWAVVAPLITSQQKIQPNIQP